MNLPKRGCVGRRAYREFIDKLNGYSLTDVVAWKTGAALKTLIGMQAAR
jgi:hypothetical protein